jgi:3'-5' exonuclease
VTIPAITCVLDIETGPRSGVEPVQLRDDALTDVLSRHALTCATVLLVDDASGRVELASRSSGAGEHELLDWLDAVLPAPGRGVLVTFNGAGFDLLALRSRAMATWSFGLERLTSWAEGRGRHIDLMLELSADGAGRWPSLAAACGSIGVPAKVLPPRARRGPDAVLLANQCDVVATYLLHLHLVAFRERSALPLVRGWVRLADELGGEAAPSHLLPYTAHPRLQVARSVLQNLESLERRA